MLQEVPLIQRRLRGNQYQYNICAEGVFLLKTLKSKKLRIIFNITHKAKTLNQFNHWFFNKASMSEEEVEPSACLAISRRTKQISEDRVIVILTAYQCCEDEPMMVLLGYLGASVFIYHHFWAAPSPNSALTTLLSKLLSLLSATDIEQLNKELSFAKGYAQNPYFLCLLDEKEPSDSFNQLYRCQESEGKEDLNRAVQTLIDYFPMRKGHSIALNQQNVSAIGQEFQSSILGRTVFNFEFTGGTLENLCYDCCQAFNLKKKINLNDFYHKIIQNQKARLEGESLQHFMTELSGQFFFGTKLDWHGENTFPISSYELLRKHKSIADQVLQTSLQSATSCMTLNEFRSLQKVLRKSFDQKLQELQNANAQHANTLCNQCYGMLDNISENQFNTDNLQTLFRQVQNKLQLFVSECQVLTRSDQIQRLLWQFYNQLFQKYFEHLEYFSRQVVNDLLIQNQEQRVEIEQLRYRIKLRENDLKTLQYEYEVQGDILNETKCKLLCEDDSPPPQQYTFETNRLRRKLQQLQQEVKDKNLHIEELESVLQRFQISWKDKDKAKFKFSKQIQELMKDVSQKVNSYYNIVREAKDTNQLQDQLRKRFAKERAAIQEERNQIKKDLAKKDSQIIRLKEEKKFLEQSLGESRRCIEVLKTESTVNKESINELEKNCAQMNCFLAETEHILEYYRKGLQLIGEQAVKGGKNQKLLKFWSTCTESGLKDLLRPFVKK